MGTQAAEQLQNAGNKSSMQNQDTDSDEDLASRYRTVEDLLARAASLDKVQQRYAIRDRNNLIYPEYLMVCKVANIMSQDEKQPSVPRMEMNMQNLMKSINHQNAVLMRPLQQ